jgi:hypothetical protein
MLSTSGVFQPPAIRVHKQIVNPFVIAEIDEKTMRRRPV